MKAFLSRLASGKTNAITLAVVLIALSLGVILPRSAESQFGRNRVILRDSSVSPSPQIATEGLDANINLDFVLKGSGRVNIGFLDATTGTFFGAVTADSIAVTGSITAGAGVARTYFIRAVDHCRADTPSATLVATRIGLGDWALARTAAGAETYNITCNFPFPYRLAALKGWRLDSFSVAHQITVVNLTSATFGQLSQVVYANNVANAVSAYGGAIGITLPTVVQANPYLTAATVGTPAFVGTANNSVNIEWQVVMANTGVYRLYGIVANFTEALY